MAVQAFYVDIDLKNNRLLNVLVNPVTAAEKNSLASTLGSQDAGYVIWNLDDQHLWAWDGNDWTRVGLTPELETQLITAYNATITDVSVSSSETTRTIQLDTINNGPLTASFEFAYIHVQSQASSTWNVTHNLNKYPSVTIVDSAETEVIGDVQYIDSNNLTITFTAAFSGKVYLN